MELVCPENSQRRMYAAYRVMWRAKRWIASRTWLVAMTCLVPGLVLAEGSPQQGRRFVEAHCARCHAVGKTGPSPLAIAPPFRTLHERYPVEDLREALAEGIVTGHPAMPEFRLDSDQIEDVVAYLKTLEE